MLVIKSNKQERFSVGEAVINRQDSEKKKPVKRRIKSSNVIKKYSTSLLKKDKI